MSNESKSKGRRLSVIVAAAIVVVVVVIAATAVVLISVNSSKKADKIPQEVKTYAADWPLPMRDYNNSRATAESTINSQNVGTLAPAWSYSIPGIGTFGAANSVPLILGNKVLFQDARANVVALDFRNGSVLWSQMYNATQVEGPNGPAVGYGKVFVAKDAFTMAALDFNTGHELWTKKLSNVVTTGIDIQPIVYDNKVYTSTVPGTGDIFYAPGGIGTIYALDQATGNMKWNFSTVKDGNLWGHPEVNSGGGCWYPPAVDTDTGTMYWGISNPAPFAGAPGWPSGSSFDTALYTDSLAALDASSGKLEWYNQVLHHDIWDHDFQISPILAKTTVNNVMQNVVFGAGKMGNVYAFNRTTGGILWTCPVGQHMNDYMDQITSEIEVMPGVLGGVETPMAYANGILYVPVVDLSTKYTPTGLNASSINFSAGKGELVAIDARYGHIIWQKSYDSLNVGGATVVNDVVFTATIDGLIYGYQALTGEELFTYKAPVGINAWPAIAGDTVIWPCGLGANPSLLALRLNAGLRMSIVMQKDGTPTPGPRVAVALDVASLSLVAKCSQIEVTTDGGRQPTNEIDGRSQARVAPFAANG